MSPIWLVVVPLFLIPVALVALWTAKRLRFFSQRARDLEEVHVEFQELRIEEFEDLVCAQADQYINREWRLNLHVRRQACLNRIKIVRGWLHRMVVNGALCMEVARFNIARLEQNTNLPPMNHDHLAYRLFDRGAMCQFIAAVCLTRLYWMELCMIAWPFYLPRLAECFELRGHSLAAWYGHLIEDILELADEDERHWLYENVLFMLTGLVEISDPVQT